MILLAILAAVLLVLAAVALARARARKHRNDRVAVLESGFSHLRDK